MNRPIRNIAIIAHVDHGKTTLVDCLLKQSGTFAAHERMGERIMDSNDIERERGITILAKNCAIEYGGTRINIVDTPGHADFGGEVERVLSMVDGVLLLVDAVEGPMPQTRFVTRKALALGLKAIVVVNKIDRPGSRPAWVIDQTFDLFDKLGASDAQLDFPVIYASALQGWASTDYTERRPDMSALFEAILTHVPPPAAAGGPAAAAADLDARLQLLRRPHRHRPHPPRRGAPRGDGGAALRRRGPRHGQDRAGAHLHRPATQARSRKPSAGDIVAVTGIEDVNIGLTVCDPEHAEGLPPISVDEPTLAMNFQVNTSPLAGREGKFVTSRQIRERLYRELQSNVALRVEDTDEPDVLRVSGPRRAAPDHPHREHAPRGLRAGGVAPAGADQARQWRGARALRGAHRRHRGEPPGRRHGSARAARRAELTDMSVDGNGRVRLEYRVPARGLIGFQGEFMTLTRGTGLISHIFDGFAPVKGEIPDRHNGVLISNENGEAVAYALFNLQERGRLFVEPRREALRGHDHRHPQPRQRPGREPDQDQEAHQHPRRRQGRRDPADAADRADARVRGGVHRRRRAGRGDARPRSASASAS